jgi:seryl-tRNA synthetase
MKNLMTLALTLTLTASAALAGDHMSQIANHARDLATDYRKMTVTLKDKRFPTQDLQQEMKEADVALAKVKELVAEYAAMNPNLSAAQQKDWKMVQDLVTLLTVFQDRKTELLAGDNPHKKRGVIQGEALALVTRATLLEQTALRLASGTPQS